MKLKANLHFHSADDPQDRVDYDFFEGVDEAARLGFEVLALTCHNAFIEKSDYAAYALRRNILLIPGIELTIQKYHVVVLNPQKDIERVRTFANLSHYKNSHPEIFIIAPHPFFYGSCSLKEKLEEHITLFDAVEQSWFYSNWFNRNKKGEAAAKKHNLPFLATSDTHILRFLDTSYAVIETEAKTKEGVFAAIRKMQFSNITAPRNFWGEMVWPLAKFELKNRIKKSHQGY